MTTLPTSALPEPPAETLVSAQSLVATYERAGYARAHPAILQPAEPFLDLSGEDIRARMFLTAGRAGEELCLRPDFTIPVSRDYLASPAAGRPQGYCYLGPVFRDRGDCRVNSCRPGSSLSGEPTRPPPTPKRWRSDSRPPRISAARAPRS